MDGSYVKLQVFPVKIILILHFMFCVTPEKYSEQD